MIASFGQDIAMVLEGGARVLIYNGDCDFMCDWIGSKRLLEGLTWPHRLAWLSAQDTPYIVATMQSGLQRSSHSLTFLQIYNSGHLVPHDQPEVALAMMRDFVNADSAWGASSTRFLASSFHSDDLTRFITCAVVALGLVAFAAKMSLRFVLSHLEDGAEDYLALCSN